MYTISAYAAVILMTEYSKEQQGRDRRIVPLSGKQYGTYGERRQFVFALSGW